MTIGAVSAGKCCDDDRFSADALRKRLQQQPPPPPPPPPPPTPPIAPVNSDNATPALDVYA